NTQPEAIEETPRKTASTQKQYSEPQPVQSDEPQNILSNARGYWTISFLCENPRRTRPDHAVHVRSSSCRANVSASAAEALMVPRAAVGCMPVLGRRVGAVRGQG